MKFLIVGFGSVGRRHFRNLLELGERDILFLRTGNSTLSEEELAGFPIETEIERALEHQPDAVIIANPSAYHLDAAIPAAQRGCHILLEKPVSHSMDRVDDLRRILSQTGSRVLVGFQFRFHPNLLQIKALLAEGRIGRPLYLRSHWGEYLPDWHPWEDYKRSYSARKDLGGGVLLTLCHSLDYLTWIFGEPQIKCSLLGHNSGLGIEVEDTAEVGLLFPGELIGSMHLNYTQIPSKHTLEIIGTGGSIIWDYYQNAVTVTRRGNVGADTEILKAAKNFQRNDLFLDEMKHFRDVVDGKAEPLCTFEDGIIALKLALTARDQG